MGVFDLWDQVLGIRGHGSSLTALPWPQFINFGAGTFAG